MRKFLVLFSVLVLFILPKNVHALVTDEGVTREKTVVLHFTTAVPVNTSLSGTTVPRPMLVDLISLSTTSGLFPHKDTGEIDISHFNFNLDKPAASTGTVRLGVITMVSPSTGSVSFFYSFSFQKNVSNNGLPIPMNQTPSFVRCRVNSGMVSTTNFLVDGLTPYILTNETRSGSGLYASTNSVPSPISAGAVLPRVGDIVLEYNNFDAANTIPLNVDIWYHSEPR